MQTRNSTSSRWFWHPVYCDLGHTSCLDYSRQQLLFILSWCCVSPHTETSGQKCMRRMHLKWMLKLATTMILCACVCVCPVQLYSRKHVQHKMFCWLISATSCIQDMSSDSQILWEKDRGINYRLGKWNTVCVWSERGSRQNFKGH